MCGGTRGDYGLHEDEGGTAEKLICNMISTELMVQAGKVYGNLMVDVQPTNEKLVGWTSTMRLP